MLPKLRELKPKFQISTWERKWTAINIMMEI